MIKNSKFNQNSKFKIQNFKLQSFPKILIAFFLTVFIAQIICLFFLLAAPVASQAIEFKPQIPIPGAKTSGFKQDGSYTFQPNDSTAPIAMYIRIIYNYAIGIIGILAAVVLMVGGVLWIVAGGNATQIGEAKAWIGAALTGLVLALTSYLILSTVNPALVNLEITKINSVAEFIGGSCTLIESPWTCTDNVTEENCIKTYAIFQKGATCPTNCCAWGRAGIGSNLSFEYDDCNYSKGLTEGDCQKLAGSSYYSYIENRTCQKTYSAIFGRFYTYRQCTGGILKATNNPKSCCSWGLNRSYTSLLCDNTGTISKATCENKPNYKNYAPQGKCVTNGNSSDCVYDFY